MTSVGAILQNAAVRCLLLLALSGACASIAPSSDEAPPAPRAFSTTVLGRALALGDGGIPYPLSRLLDHLDGLSGARMVATHIPHGRSLVRDNTDFSQPRTVVGWTSLHDPGPSTLPLAGRLFLGFAEATDTVEVIAWDPTTGRFEFELITDYREGGAKELIPAERALCTTCHQSALPIFTPDPWAETSDNEQIVRSIVDARLEGAPHATQSRRLDLHFELIHMDNHAFSALGARVKRGEEERDRELAYWHLLWRTNRLHHADDIKRFNELRSDPTLPPAYRINGVDILTEEAVFVERAVEEGRVLAQVGDMWRTAYPDEACRQKLLVAMSGGPVPDDLFPTMAQHRDGPADRWLAVASPVLPDRDPFTEEEVTAVSAQLDATRARPLVYPLTESSLSARADHTPWPPADRAFLNTVPPAEIAATTIDVSTKGLRLRYLTNELRRARGVAPLFDPWLGVESSDLPSSPPAVSLKTPLDKARFFCARCHGNASSLAPVFRFDSLQGFLATVPRAAASKMLLEGAMPPGGTREARQLDRLGMRDEMAALVAP